MKLLINFDLLVFIWSNQICQYNIKLSLSQYCKNQSNTYIFRICPIPVSPITARLESAGRFDNRKEKSQDQMTVVCWSSKWRDADQTESWQTLKMYRMHLLKIILDTTICQEWKQMLYPWLMYTRDPSIDRSIERERERERERANELGLSPKNSFDVIFNNIWLNMSN